MTFSSCSQKNEPWIVGTDTTVKQHIFELLLVDRVPESFKNLMMRHVMKGNTLCYLFETIYPECSGILDSRGFYCDALDNGKWVDKVLFAYQEARMGDEVLSLLEDEASILPPVDATIDTTIEEASSDMENEGDTQSEVPAVEKLLADSYGKLKLMEFGQERFFPQTEGQNTIFVHYSDNNAVRLFYDTLFRLVKKEYWKMTSIEDSKITATELYEYQGQSKNPVQKIIENDTAKIVSKLDENGLVIKAEKFKVDANDAKAEGNNLPVNITEWLYDSEHRITTETVTDISYNAFGKILKTTVKKQMFDYKKTDAAKEKAGEENKEENDIPPDYEYFEDGILKRKTEYTTKGTFTNLIVFDELNSVKTYYEDYAKVKDVYITDGTERRVKIYE